MSKTLHTPDVPYLTTEQMVEVDRAMMNVYGIELIQMMENAGRNLAHLARNRFLDGDPRGCRVVVLAGTGGNGGGALVAARRLHNWGSTVEVFVTAADSAFKRIPAHQLDILRRMEVWVGDHERLGEAEPANVVLDGLIGYSLRGAPYGPAADLIRWANGQGAPILALDAPSGVDTTTGTVYDPAVSATATMTLALPKEGLRTPDTLAHVGELYLADISVPPALYGEPALDLAVEPLFAEEEVIRLA